MPVGGRGRVSFVARCAILYLYTFLVCVGSLYSRIFSCSIDCDAAVWDLSSGQRIKKLSGHEDIVNACAAAKRDHPNLLVTGSDDGSTKVTRF